MAASLSGAESAQPITIDCAVQLRLRSAISLLAVIVLVYPSSLSLRAQSTNTPASIGKGRVALGPTINTSYHEVAPIITPDGRTLFFHRFFHPANVGGVDGGEDVWVSVLNADLMWGEPCNVGPPLNTMGNNFVTSVSPDGKTLYLGNVYNQDGTLAGGLSRSRRDGDSWSFPEPVRITGFRNFATRSFFSISADGKTMILEIDNAESFGMDDLYVSFAGPDGIWSRPVNLGPVINTPGREITPYLAPDGRTLYFSSDGRPGLGDQDIYVSRRLDESWLSWSPPVNLGPLINTSGWDAYFTIPAGGTVAYMVNYTGEATNSDIVRVLVPPEFRPDPTVVVSGACVDAVSGERLVARVVVRSSDTLRDMSYAVTDHFDPEFTVVLGAGATYLVHAEREGYLPIDSYVDLVDSTGSGDLRVELRLVPLVAGTTFSLGRLYFDFGRAEIHQEAYPELRRLAEAMATRPTMTIEIRGHTDSVGVDDSNYLLSVDRAANVAAYLISIGVDPSRLSVVGLGRTRPVADNRTRFKRQLNRRVEFTIVTE